MTSGTSSKWVVFKGALKRFKWLSILFSVALFLEMPLLVWMEISRQLRIHEGDMAQVVNNSYLTQVIFNPIEHFTNMAVSIIFGLILFYYLQNDKASTFFHSLPIKRWSLYLQNLMAGLTLIWLPILINGLLTYGVFNFFGITEISWQNPNIYNPAMDMVNTNIPKTISAWQVIVNLFSLNLLMTGLFFSFTVFVGMFTGNVLLQGALTLIGLVLPLGIYVLVKYNLWELLYGYSRDFNDRDLAQLSPLVSYLDNSFNRFMFKEIIWYVWLIITLILCGLSIFLYKKRPAEAAGETLAAEWIRRLFKYGVTSCAALTGGSYFSTMNEDSLGALYLGYLVGSVLGYIVADMVAYKSFHFYKRWKGMAAFGVVFILIIASINLDLYGFENYVPDQDDVKEVFLGNLNPYGFPQTRGLTGEDNIERVRKLHQQIIKLQEQNKTDEKSNRNRQRDITKIRGVNESTAVPVEPVNLMIGVNITYVLESGEKVKRNYTIDSYRYRELLRPIFNSEEAKKLMHGRLFKTGIDKIDQINVNNHHIGKNIRIYKRAEINEAIAALRKDVLNTTYEATVENKVPSRASIELVTPTGADQNFVTYHLNYYSDFKNFEAFLQARGYLKELFLNPEEVSKIVVKRVGTDKTVEVKDKDNIKMLLDLSNLEDEKSFIVRQKQTGQMDGIIYYGKIEQDKGSPLYVIFDNSIYYQQLIYDILKKAQ